MSLVMKFGGSSVADAARLAQVGELVTAAMPRRPLVVLSATGKTTNALVAAAEAAEAGRTEEALGLSAQVRRAHEAIAHELLGGVSPELESAFDALFGDLDSLLRAVAILAELSPRSRDAILSTGERLSTRLLSDHLGVPLLDARQLVHTDSRHGAARPDTEAIARSVQRRAVPALEEAGAAVTQGFIGSDAHGTTTTLGRGGSDYSASLLGPRSAPRRCRSGPTWRGCSRATRASCRPRTRCRRCQPPRPRSSPRSAPTCSTRPPSRRPWRRARW